jgi:predicted AAA+ superfamily ATPase
MKPSRAMLEDHLERYEGQLKGLKSYLTELKEMTTRYGTEREQFESDLVEAEHNIKYYEGEIARIKEEMGERAKGERPKTVPDTILPRTAKQGIGSFVISSVSFITGALLGSKMKSRSKDKPGDKEEP